jgi:hypothetical protein
MKYSVGIDIGKNGGIVIISEDGKITTHAMPKVNKDEIDIHAIGQIFQGIPGPIHCGIEDVHSIFGVGAKANFQFGRSLGIVEGIVAGYNIAFTKISPKIWQKEMWMGIKPVEVNTGKKTKEGNIKYKVDTKATSLLAAKRLYPDLDLRDANVRKTSRSKEAHDGIVDAVLIATFVKRKLQ